MLSNNKIVMNGVDIDSAEGEPSGQVTWSGIVLRVNSNNDSTINN